MPAPAHEPRPRSAPYLTRSLSPSSVPMKDLLASCASAAAVSTPPCEPSAAAVAEAALAEAAARDAETGDLEPLREREQRRDAARERDAA
ncbi:hypothetical protein ACIRQP_07780 [Streptomyces sp. NPDC102274]|uniref:hypothetical protein n=1 Tax=Streptomyces sp. NPDC102274 TaxID=3366151 RepID=UPI00382606E1